MEDAIIMELDVTKEVIAILGVFDGHGGIPNQPNQ